MKSWKYNYYSNKSKADKLIIATTNPPNPQNVQYLIEFMTNYNILIYHQQIIMETMELSKVY